MPHLESSLDLLKDIQRKLGQIEICVDNLKDNLFIEDKDAEEGTESKCK